MTTQQYKNFGFSMDTGVVSKKNLQEVEKILETIMKNGESYEYYENDVLIRIENFFHVNENLKKNILTDNLLQKIKQFLGEEPVLFKDKINFKYPGGVADDLHQDIQAGWEQYGTSDFITVGIALDKCDISTSCVYFYKKEVEERKRMLGNDYEPLSWDDFDKTFFVPAILNPGDVTFHDAYVPHYSEAQKSKNQRRVMWLTFNGISAGDNREKYYEDKLKSFPPNNKRKAGINYEYKV
jgi:ectoine hydroxylase-related dioxygenase (phytanoyl-CoA dioxygenase family)